MTKRRPSQVLQMTLSGVTDDDVQALLGVTDVKEETLSGVSDDDEETISGVTDDYAETLSCVTQYQERGNGGPASQLWERR